MNAPRYDIRDVADRMGRGHRLSAIARSLNVGESTLWYALKRAGFPTSTVAAMQARAAS